MYKYDAGQLSRVSLPEDQLSALSQPGLDSEWSNLTNPAVPQAQRDALAADLFSLPTDGMPECMHEGCRGAHVRDRVKGIVNTSAYD